MPETPIAAVVVGGKTMLAPETDNWEEAKTERVGRLCVDAFDRNFRRISVGRHLLILEATEDENGADTKCSFLHYCVSNKRQQ